MVSPKLLRIEVQNLVCPRCEREEEHGNDRREEEHIGISVNGILEKLEQFCYLGDTFDYEAGVERSVRAAVEAAWGRY